MSFHFTEICQLAKQAGLAILNIYQQKEFSVDVKQDMSPLTMADLAAHQVIAEGLSQLTPEIPVLSEESANVDWPVRSGWQQFWLVDPLDGTKEFIKRNGEFTVNIALVRNGVPVAGVVYAPVLEVCYYTDEAGLAWVQYGNAEPMQIAVQQAEVGECVRVVASRSHRDARTDALLQKLGDHACVSMGSSLKLCLVAEGKAHFYPRLAPTMEWDTAAADAVVRAAGGIVCDLEGQPLRYNKPDLHNPEFLVVPAADQARYLALVS